MKNNEDTDEDNVPSSAISLAKRENNRLKQELQTLKDETARVQAEQAEIDRINQESLENQKVILALKETIFNNEALILGHILLPDNDEVE
ncbi:hypothetical protein [Candidatus Trichorickettsia mobilis]|jgi:hypothetical protein|uniref:hypothetical protein n=1 Tax=Candidatus Trichorickettsia mobilis TaxID=1346319 RepID=UPI00293110E8|nr:hypothetical protein [Candidatus Trichorickettsia mobilis]